MGGKALSAANNKARRKKEDESTARMYHMAVAASDKEAEQNDAESTARIYHMAVYRSTVLSDSGIFVEVSSVRSFGDEPLTARKT